MEVDLWLTKMGFKGDPFVIVDADKDPYLDNSLVQNTSLESILNQFDTPTPYVIFGIRGSGKSAMRIFAEKALKKYNKENPSKEILIIKYIDFNELLSEKKKPRKIPKKVRRFVFFSRIEYQGHENREITLDDHLDNILKLGIESFMEHIDKKIKDAGKKHVKKHFKESSHLIEKILLLISLYYAPNDRSKKLKKLKETMTLLKYKKSGKWFKKKQKKEIAEKIYLNIKGIPVSTEDALATVQTTGVGLYDTVGVPQNTEDRFSLFRYFMEIIDRLELKGIYLLVDRVDEPTSIKGDSEGMRKLISPLLEDQLLQVKNLGVLLFLPFELADLRKKYRSDRVKTTCPLQWTNLKMKELIEKRMKACSSQNNSISIHSMFSEKGEEKADIITNLTTPRNAFRFLSILIKEHCNTVKDAIEISSETFNSAWREYQNEKEGY